MSTEINRVYHGLLKKRKHVEEALGPMLPPTAQILFAHGMITPRTVPDGGPPEQQVDVMVFWAIDHKFFYVVGQSLIIYDLETGKPEQLPFQFKDARIRSPKETLDMFDIVAEKQGWKPNFRAAFKAAYKRMVRMQDIWDNGPVDLPEAPPTPLPEIQLERSSIN